MVHPVQSPDILDIVPEHVADPVRRAPWPARLLAGSGDVILSLLLNGVVLGSLVAAGWPLRPMPTPQAISVDLVDHMPGSAGEGSGTGKAGAQNGTAATATDATPTPDLAKADQDHKQAAPPPESAKLPEREPASEPVQKTPPAPATNASTAEARPDPVPPPPPETATPAVPPPPEHADNNPQPHLVEAPSAPPPAPTQAHGPSQPPAVPPPSEAQASPATESPALRPVQSAADGEDAVPPPSPPPEAPKPLTAEQKRQAENTAKLAALLPFGSAITADPFQAQAAGQGQGASTAYRGQVYANFNKAQDVIADAKAKHLKGQAVVAFTIDDHGGIASIGIAVSSKNPAVDEAALELIRRAAPFPPPPPGAQRSFSPAIGLGLDD